MGKKDEWSFRGDYADGVWRDGVTGDGKPVRFCIRLHVEDEEPETLDDLSGHISPCAMHSYEDEAPDPVNHPSHYTQGGIECIDAIQAALTPEEFRGYCKGNALKYTWRERHKGGTQDLRKADWYLSRID